MEELMGTIKLFAGNFPPLGYEFCHGQLIPIQQNAALFSIIGTTYGGDGRSNFALPDLRCRVPVGAGQGLGLSTNIVIGAKVGTENNVLVSRNIPTLQGSVNFSNITGRATGDISTSASASIALPCSTTSDNGSPVNNVIGTEANSAELYASSPEPGKFMKPFTVNLPINFNANLPVSINGGVASVVVNQGSNSTPVNNLQPSLGLNYIICTQGIFPSRP